MDTPVNVKKVHVNFEVKPKKNDFEEKNQINEEAEKLKNQLEAELEEKRLQVEEELNTKLKKSEDDYNEIISKAYEEKEEIINIAKEDIKIKEKEAYEKGYSEGRENGYEDGYKEAYDDNIEKAKLDATNIINEAENVLSNAQETVVSYLKENKQNIIDLILTISEKVLREKFKELDSINSLVTTAIGEYELKRNFVIKVNPIYKESLKEQIQFLKATKKVESEVFLLCDSNVEEGNAIIESENGKITVGIDSILERIKEELI